MQLITLAEFRRCLALSSQSTLWMLEHNTLPCHLDSHQGIMVDMESLEVQTIVRGIAARKAQLINEAAGPLVERIGLVLAENLDGLVERALALAATTINNQQLTCQVKGKTEQ